MSDKKCKLRAVSKNKIKIKCPTDEQVDELMDKMDAYFYRDNPAFTSFNITVNDETLEAERVRFDKGDLLDGLALLDVDLGRYEKPLGEQAEPTPQPTSAQEPHPREQPQTEPEHEPDEEYIKKLIKRWEDAQENQD